MVWKMMIYSTYAYRKIGTPSKYASSPENTTEKNSIFGSIKKPHMMLCSKIILI